MAMLCFRLKFEPHVWGDCVQMGDGGPGGQAIRNWKGPD